jgi:uncharacterized membrane protein (UPF0127 family)
MIRSRRLLAAAFIPWTAFVQQYGAPKDLSHVNLKIAPSDCAQAGGGKAIRAQIAREQPTREKGLSHRKRPLAANEGMLFVYDPPRDVEIWMKDTYIPLAIGFFGTDSRLIQTYDMPVEADPSNPARTYPSGGPSSAVLEAAPATSFKSGNVLCVAPPPMTKKSADAPH